MKPCLRLAVAFLAAVSACSAACSGTTSSNEDLPGNHGSDAGRVPGNEGQSEPGSCQSEKPTGPPAVKGAGGGPEIVVALKTLDFHEAGGSEAVGFDLDDACTCNGDGPTCALPANSTKPCDGTSGRDNNGAGLMSASSMLGLTSSMLSKDIADGEMSLLLRIRDYNGLPDDDQVSVAWLVPVPLMSPPLFDGTDVWGINGSCLHQDGQGQPNVEDPLVIDLFAYVTGGRLVASFNGGAPMNFSEKLSVNVQGAVLSAGLVRQGTVWEIHDGVVAGTWRTTDMFANLRNTSVLGKPLCTDNPIYMNVKDFICRSRDISSTGANPAHACDSISFAFTFTAISAGVGLGWNPPALPNPCTPEVDPANDACD
jgi:hypothetical protein